MKLQMVHKCGHIQKFTNRLLYCLLGNAAASRVARGTGYAVGITVSEF